MRLLKRALWGFTGHARLHALTLAVVALSFLAVGTLRLVYVNLNQAIAGWQSQFRMLVVLRPSVDPERALDLKRELSALPGVSGAEYVDSSAALDALSERLAQMKATGGPSRAHLLELVADNPLPSTIRLRVRADYLSPAALSALARRAEAVQGVAEVRYGDAWVARFYSFFRLFKLVAAATSGLLFVAAAFIISSQLRLVLVLRRNEIGLMRLLGAGAAYIGAPYVLEGALLGTAGAALAVGALFGLYRLFVAQAGTEFENLLQAASFLPPAATLGLVGFGAAVGVLGSLISLRRL